MNSNPLGQQVVTLQKATNRYQSASSTTMWQVQEGYGIEPCQNGDEIKCGDTVRLMHVNTQKYLHTHHIPSVLSSHNQEVSAFGSGNDASDPSKNGHLFTEGDKLDDWELVCGDTHWRNGDVIKLKHAVTGVYLGR